MADPLDTILHSLDKGDYVKVLLGALILGIVFLWRHNIWLTKELLRVTQETTKALEGTLIELRSKARGKD